MTAKQLTACLAGIDARRTGALTPAASAHFLPPPYCLQVLVPPKVRPSKWRWTRRPPSFKRTASIVF